MPKLVQALLEAAGFETATTYGEPLLLPKPEVEAAKSKPKDRTAAERQRRYRASKRDRGVTTVTGTMTNRVTEMVT